MLRFSVFGTSFGLCACVSGGSSQWVPDIVIPVSLEATFITRTECGALGDHATSVALDYGASRSTYSRSDGTTTFYSQSSASNVRVYSCPQAAVAKLTAMVPPR